MSSSAIGGIVLIILSMVILMRPLELFMRNGNETVASIKGKKELHEVIKNARIYIFSCRVIIRAKLYFLIMDVLKDTRIHCVFILKMK